MENDDTSVWYFRVQGGEETNGKVSEDRIIVNMDGSISIPNKTKSLYVSAYNLDHARYFQTLRPGSEIVAFKVPKELDAFIRETVISQKYSTTNPLNQGGTAPLLVDETTPGISYQLKAPWIEWLEEYGHSARIIE